MRDVLRTLTEGKSGVYKPDDLPRLGERWWGSSGRRYVDLKGYDQISHWSGNKPTFPVGWE